MAYGYLKRFAAGAVFGLYMAYLLYFLNPQLDTDVSTMVVAGVVYSTIGGLVFGSIVWALRLLRVRLFGRGDTTSRHGFGNVAAAAAVAAAVYWLHLAMFRIYLPRGAVRMLSKATILIAAAAFVLFVLWLLERNASRRRSRLIFACGMLVVLTSAVLLYQRREGYRQTRRGVVYAEVDRVAAQRPIVVIALRGVPYDSVLTAIGEGLMPELESLTRDAFVTRVQPFRTTSPKAVWASLATGQLPNRHGVTGRFSYQTALNRKGERFTILPTGVGFSGWGLVPPIRRHSAPIPAGESLAFWDIFSRVGIPWTVVNWPGVAASPDANGVVISERLIRGRPAAGPALPREISAAVSPGRRASLPRAMVARTERLGGSLREGVTARFLEDARAADFMLAAMKARPVPLSVVALKGHADIATAVGGGSNTLPSRDSAAGDALRGHLMLLDSLIRQLREARPDALFAVVSPSAATPPPVPLSLLTATQTIRDLADPGQADGFILLAGAGVRSRPNPQSVSVTDIVPTILFSAGIPNARDFDGEVITDAFDDQFLREHAATYIPSYQAARFYLRR